MMPVVVAVSLLGAAFLGIAALGATSMRAAKFLTGSSLLVLAESDF